MEESAILCFASGSYKNYGIFFWQKPSTVEQNLLTYVRMIENYSKTENQFYVTAFQFPLRDTLENFSFAHSGNIYIRFISLKDNLMLYFPSEPRHVCFTH